MTENYRPETTGAWKKLTKLAADNSAVRLDGLFTEDGDRAERLTLAEQGLSVDFSKNLVDREILDTLFELADQAPLAEMAAAMFAGEAINSSENRPVLHTALRADGETLNERGMPDIAEAVAAQKARIKSVSDAIRSGARQGSTGKVFTDVVNLGIGGSDLGPRMVCEALKEYASPLPRVHFVSNVDGEVIRSTLSALDAETTLIIVCSKSFTTHETMLNADAASAWISDKLGLKDPFSSDHFIAVTAAPEAAAKAGIAGDNILTFENWVGGRYSLWSSVGLAIAVAIGYEAFEDLLSGAAVMDEHFLNRPWHSNIPVMQALLGIWYDNFLGAESQAIIPYCDRLNQLPFYIQQLDMESNGKSVNRHGQGIPYATAPIIWGAAGTDSQHSFFQLIHQGTHLIPLDFIGVIDDPMSDPEQHRVLLANMLAQGAALMSGKENGGELHHRYYAGNKPSTTILLDRLTPENLGALIAMYEHKVCAQGWIWNINSFDQWGVELGKSLAKSLLSGNSASLDPSTMALAKKISIQ